MKVSRRRLLATSALGISGATAIKLSSNTGEATAQVEASGLDIPDVTKQSKKLDDVSLNVNANVSWDSDLSPSSWSLILSCGNTEPKYPIAKVESDGTLLQSGADQIDITGSIVSTPAFDLTDFQTDSETSTRMVVGLEFQLLKDGDTLASAIEKTQVQITVIGGEIEANIELSATGDITFE